MGKRKISEDDYSRIVQLKQDGYANAELAKMFSVTSGYIGQILRANGINSVNERYMSFSEEDCCKIIELYHKGMSVVKIGQIFNCSKSPIAKILKKYGVKIDNVCRKIPESEYQNVVDLYNSGKTTKEVAQIYNCEPYIIRSVMQKMNADLRPNYFTAADAEKMYQMYKNGKRVWEIAEQYNTDRQTVSRVFKRNGYVTDPKTYHCNEHYFDTINDANQAYILGLFWADGCNDTKRGKITLQLQEKDKHILEEIGSVVQSDMPLWFLDLNNKNQNWSNTYTLTLRSKHMSELLANYGMVAKKSLVLTFPEWMDKSLYCHFIRGYIDGDGSIYYSEHKNVLRVSMIGTKMFVERIQDICSQIGVKTSIYHKPEHNDIICTLSTTSNPGSVKLLNWIYQDADLKLQRKYYKYQEFLKQHK